MDEQERERAPGPGTHVGLGRVVANPTGLGRAERHAGQGPLVEETSEDSFPASDPPGFMSDPATPGDGSANPAAGPTGRPSA